MKDAIIITVILVVVFSLIIGMAFFSIKKREENIAQKRAEGWLPISERCENAGGIFIQGGWGTSNCVFPPALTTSLK